MMDYGRILSDAFRLTWRHRFLWIFGLFAGGATCTPSFQLPSGGGPSARDFGFAGPDLERFFEDAGIWLASNLGVILALGCLALLIGLAILVVSFIAQGALIGSIARLSRGEPAALGSAWELGKRFAWRYVGLFLLFIGIGLGIAIVIGAIAVILFGIGQLGRGAGTVAVVVGVLLALIGVVVAIPFLIGLAIVFNYAQRGIAVDNLRVIDAVERGISLLRSRLGPSLILWLISLAVGLGAGLALVIAAVVVLLPLGGLVAAAYFIWGLAAQTLVLGAVAVLVYIAVLWLLSAIVNTYIAAYWTLGYLGVTDRYPPPVEHQSSSNPPPP